MQRTSLSKEKGKWKKENETKLSLKSIKEPQLNIVLCERISTVLGITIVVWVVVWVLTIIWVVHNNFEFGAKTHVHPVTVLSMSGPAVTASSANKAQHVMAHESTIAKPVEEQKSNTNVEKFGLGPTYQNPLILENNCSVTILLMDPRISTAKIDSPIWYAIESVVANIHESARPNACMLIQTSSCRYTKIQSIYDETIKKAKPLFKNMIESGNVRMVPLDHLKYNLKSCQNFYNPSFAWMHHRYWRDEFIAQDSDMVLSIQNDSVLCHKFNPNLWRDMAFVGAVWPPRANMHNNPEPKIGCCRFFETKWNEWNKWSVHDDIQPYPDDLCTFDNGIAPLGNGGLTIRSRKWLIKAIEYCPHPTYSGFDKAYLHNTKCMVPQPAIPAEDVYFGLILKGLRAPLPTGFESALFSVEMIFAEKVLEYYSTPSNRAEGEQELENMVVKRWGADQLELFRNMRKEGQTIPIGFHKPYWYHDRSLLLSQRMHERCQFLANIIPKKW